MKWFCSAQALTLLALLLTVLLPAANGKAIAAQPDTATGNDLSVELSTDAAGAPEPAEDVTTVKETPTTTTINPTINEVDEIPSFNRNQVTLDLPGDLFSTTANLTLRLRTFIGDFITRTSVRIAQVVRFFQPLFGYHLMIDIPKELDV